MAWVPMGKVPKAWVVLLPMLQETFPAVLPRFPKRKRGSTAGNAFGTARNAFPGRTARVSQLNCVFLIFFRLSSNF